MDLPPRRDDRSPLSQINVTPLVDVMLVLLIVFLVTASLDQQGITVTLPRAEAGALPSEALLTVTLDADRRLFIDTTPVDEARFPAVLRDQLAGRASKMVLLKADETVPYGEFVRLVALVRSAGVDQLGMVTEPSETRP